MDIRTHGTETDALVARVCAAALAMQRKDWEQGVVAQALLELGDEAQAFRLAWAALLYTGDDGRVAALGSTGLVDCAMLGEALWRAAEASQDGALQAAERGLRRYVLTDASRAQDGTLFHVEGQMWVDSFHCAPPYLAVIGEHDEALRQIEGLRRRLWNPDAKLFSHIWDETEQKFARRAFWGVGNGWAAAGLTRVLPALPPRREADRGRLVRHLRDLLDGCLAHQRSDGLFHNVLDRPDTFIETNAAQMFAYAIYTGVRGGWLPREYVSAADRMRLAARAQVDDLGFVQGVCGAPEFDSPGIAPEGQAFFLRMETAFGKLEL